MPGVIHVTGAAHSGITAGSVQGGARRYPVLPGQLSPCPGRGSGALCGGTGRACPSGVPQVLVVFGEFHSVPEHLLQQLPLPALQALPLLVRQALLVPEHLRDARGGVAQPWHSQKRCPQPCLPTCSRCCLQACISRC